MDTAIHTEAHQARCTQCQHNRRGTGRQPHSARPFPTHRPLIPAGNDFPYRACQKWLHIHRPVDELQSLHKCEFEYLRTTNVETQTCFPRSCSVSVTPLHLSEFPPQLSHHSNENQIRVANKCIQI
jgi:hypothetical protein